MSYQLPDFFAPKSLTTILTSLVMTRSQRSIYFALKFFKLLLLIIKITHLKSTLS